MCITHNISRRTNKQTLAPNLKFIPHKTKRRYASESSYKINRLIFKNNHYFIQKMDNDAEKLMMCLRFIFEFFVKGYPNERSIVLGIHAIQDSIEQQYIYLHLLIILYLNSLLASCFFFCSLFNARGTYLFYLLKLK